MPLSGAVKGFEGDVRGIGLIWQVKVRANGFKRLYDWLKGHDALAIRSDRHEWLAVLPRIRCSIYSLLKSGTIR